MKSNHTTTNHFIKKQLGLVLTTLITCVSLPVQAEWTGTGADIIFNGQAVPNQVIVKFRTGTEDVDSLAIQQSLQAQTVQNFSLVGAQLWEIGGGIESATAIQQLQNDPRVEYAEPNYLVSAATMPNDPDFSKLWGLHNTGQTGGKSDADIDAPEAWDIAQGGEV
jgi:hypothetical protein